VKSTMALQQVGGKFLPFHGALVNPSRKDTYELPRSDSATKTITRRGLLKLAAGATSAAVLPNTMVVLRKKSVRDEFVGENLSETLDVKR
jgi:hypothetical protein